MDYRTLQLAFLKVQKRLYLLQGNKYPNRKLTEYQNQLLELCEAEREIILADDFHAKDLPSYQGIFIPFIELGTLFLEDSILNLIPFETVYCLQKALKEWTDDKYIIVNSLQHNTYFFNPALSLKEQIYSLIYQNFGIKFSERLIQISIPKHEVDSYLFNIVLYHELGHFIDMKFGISQAIIGTHFRHLPATEQEKKLRHYMEFFADIFAAQYIGIYSEYVLNYKAFGIGDSNTHPATASRIDLMKIFLAGQSNEILDHIQEMTRILANNSLRIRYKEVEKGDFFNLVPCEIKDDEELHGIFVTAWNIWLNDRSTFEAKEISLEKMYPIINNLVEKSISNYMVTEEWEKITSDVSNQTAN